MKILLCIATLRSGGAEKNISFLANFLSKKNHQVTILNFDKKKNKPFFLLNKKVRVINLDVLKNSNNLFFSIYNFFCRILLIRKFLIKEKFNYFISFINTMNITMLIASMFLNILKIISDRNNPYYDRNTILIKILKILFYRHADKLVLQTKQVQKYYWFIKKKKIFLINNFFSDNFSKKTKYNLGKKIKIIIVSRIEKQKGLELLVSALNQIKKKYKFKCDIYGKGSMKIELKKTIKKNNLSKLIFLKKPTNLENIYKKYDLYILSSIYEGYPNSLVEAMITGLPVISSSCDYGPKEIIKNKYNGILFKVGSKNHLIKKIELILNDYNFARNLGKNAKHNYNSTIINKKNFDKWQKIIK